jgi:hypothetical protein
MSAEFLYSFRRLYVYYNLVIDENQGIDYDKDMAEMLGFYCNPEFYFKRKEHENAEKHVNVGYQAIIKRLEAGGSPDLEESIDAESKTVEEMVL